MKDKKACIGCYNNFYNGNNDLGVKECWLFKKAKIIFRKEVPINQRPPWTQTARKFPACYRQEGYVYAEKNATF